MKQSTGSAAHPNVARVSLLVLGTVALLAAVSGTAQPPEPRMTCDDEGWWGGGRRGRMEHVCEVQEQTLAAIGRLDVDARPNGAVHVTGWDRDEVLVRAQVRAWAEDEERAREIYEQVEVRTDGGTIRADGPSRQQGRWLWGNDRSAWTVSYEIFTPHGTDLGVETVNGGLVIEDVQGEIDAETTNGGIRLSGLGGDVRGRTTNGGLEVTLTGDTWEGEGLDLGATNGGVRLRVPEGYSARLEARTTNGGVHVDFPITVQGRLGRELSTTLGDGGPLLRVRTTNGGVRVTSY